MVAVSCWLFCFSLGCIQEATVLGRLWMHIRGSRLEERFPNHKYAALKIRGGLMRFKTQPVFLLLKDILVPPEQVIDTVDIYFLKNRHRKLSLRFLAWCLLRQDIQQDMHDSVEDARTVKKKRGI